MKPIITILGKPNVGKSSLFNALLGNNESLVANIEGLTRDKQYANLIINHSSYVLVDTGGIGLTNNEIDFAVTKSSLSSFEESDLIIALFDSSTNLSKIDAEILNYIRKASVPFIPVLNKCDLKESENNKDLYYEEGLQNIIEISVTKKEGIKTLERKIEEILPSREQAEEGMQSNLRVGIIGKPNAGKSTFFNKLLQAERSLVDKSAGTTRDSISHKLDINKAEVILTDTAGIKRKSKLNDQIDNLITRESINTLKNVDGVVFLIDVHQSISDQDLQIISLCLTSGKPIVIGLNKSENLSKSDKLILKKEINRRLSFASHLESKFISAKKNIGTKALVRGLIKIIKNSRNKISKKELNEILERIVEKNPPPISGRFRPNLKFVQLQSNRPFTISIHGNKLKDISNSYTKYIEKQFRKELDLKGVPIKIFYKTDDNPFKDKKNKLTERQLKKRARIRRR